MSKTRPMCGVDGCDQQVKVRGWCQKHYRRWRVHGDPTVVLSSRWEAEGRGYARQGDPCKIEDCERPSVTRGWCRPHYLRWQRHGDPLGGRPTPHLMNGDPICRIGGCENPRNGTSSMCGHHTYVVGRYGQTAVPQWRIADGHEIVDHYGYVRVMQRDHPMANSKGYVPKHRLVMAQHLGRSLTKDESVHHMNGDKQDNRIENLELWVGRSAQPSGQRPRDLVLWARRVLEQYADEVDAGLI